MIGGNGDHESKAGELHGLLEPSPGINVLLGANRTGKTHLMKVCYAALASGDDPPSNFWDLYRILPIAVIPAKERHPVLDTGRESTPLRTGIFTGIDSL